MEVVYYMDKKIYRRLELNVYAVNCAFDRLERALDPLNNNEIYASVGELLLWITNIDDWHEEHQGKEYKERKRSNCVNNLLYGIRFAYNSLKHNMDVLQLPKVSGGFTLPFTLPFTIEQINVLWICNEEIDVTPHENKYRWVRKQRVNYKNHLENKKVLDTLRKAYEFLESESKKILE